MGRSEIGPKKKLSVFSQNPEPSARVEASSRRMWGFEYWVLFSE